MADLKPDVSILLVDDEEQFRFRLTRAFEKRGFKVFPAANYEEAMELIAAQKPTWAVVDLKMPGKSGLDVLKDGLAMEPEMRTLVLTGYGSIATATEAIKLGAVNYLQKPCGVDDILKTLREMPVKDIQPGDPEFEAPTLARAEWEHIQRVLTDCDGNVSAAAERLGLHRRTLQRKLYKYPPNK